MQHGNILGTFVSTCSLFSHLNYTVTSLLDNQRFTDGYNTKMS